MNSTHTLAPGLADSVHDSQQAFRAVLDALARPGQVRRIGPALPGVASVSYTHLTLPTIYSV